MALKRNLVDAKDVVLPHSHAKLELYKSYLENYLRILGLSSWISKVNIYDIFCGIGLYKDGNKGSPLLAVECIKENNALFESRGWTKKQIKLSINDGIKEKIENVKSVLEKETISNCVIEYYNKDADAMLDIVIEEVNAFDKNNRNLVFIDPYGYSQISKQKISEILKRNYSEILLFLPIMQMYRFSEIALSDNERKCYENLRNFIFDFFPIDHKIHKEKIDNVFDYINEIKRALSMGDSFYTCSYYIERGKGNYYALFFISSNIYGLEKMLEVIWKADPRSGKGFKKPSTNMSLFAAYEEEMDRRRNIEYLKSQTTEYLKFSGKRISNVDLYEFVLRNEFLPKHINAVLKELKSEGMITATDSHGVEFDTKGAFYIDNEHYKKNDIKVYFILKK
ncbi:three-Cys-motif partner protein TcmP [Chitinophaga lutea]|uniref:Three-Cys-motif partner protein TcmP n=1 Tax=Chitinophaga lutea TaxID=2488634 RepID=A0A3N4PYE0_9BACT|nr:three-Cys-motif partner protein TcmP [Chitinophaga lutea]RPE08680.1 three-Cys-motif partner protein TcmP [Chitinophaga lutea]